jgi:hypothetical protein
VAHGRHEHERRIRRDDRSGRRRDDPGNTAESAFRLRTRDLGAKVPALRPDGKKRLGAFLRVITCGLLFGNNWVLPLITVYIRQIRRDGVMLNETDMVHAGNVYVRDDMNSQFYVV